MVPFSNDFKQPLTQFSRSGYTLTLKISEMAEGTAIITMEGEYKTVPKLSSSTIFNDFE